MLSDKLESERPSLARLQDLRRLPVAEQHRILEEASRAVADMYRDDLVKPPVEREWTAFTVLDGLDPVLEDDDSAGDASEHGR